MTASDPEQPPTPRYLFAEPNNNCVFLPRPRRDPDQATYTLTQVASWYGQQSPAGDCPIITTVVTHTPRAAG